MAKNTNSKNKAQNSTNNSETSTTTEMQQAIQIPRMQRETLLRMQKTATILKTAAIRTAAIRTVTATSPITKSSGKKAPFCGAFFESHIY